MLDESSVMMTIENSILQQVDSDKAGVMQDQKKGLDIIKRIIKSKKLMLHGGLAINAILPKDLKFYTDGDIPDYDVLVADDNGGNTRRIMFEAQKKLTENEYWAHFRPAIHGDTQKLHAHPKGITRLQALRYPNILDATSVKKSDYEKLSKMSSAESKLRPPELKAFSLVPTAFMKLSFHLEFSRPSVHIRRWCKIFPRSLSIYKTYPTVLLDKKSSFDANSYDLSPMFEIGKKFERTFYVGEHVALKIMGVDGKGRLGMVVKNLGEVHDAFTEKGFKPSDIVPESFFLPEHFRVDDSCIVYAWEECTSITGPESYGTSDGVLRYLYGEYLQYGTTSLIDDLIDFQLKQDPKSLENGLSKRFNIECN